MRKIILAFLIIFFAGRFFAQEASFTFEVSNDTVLIGNYFIVKYKISNIEGEFEAPEFSDFELLAGPMSNSMYSMINGNTKTEIAYTYYLKPIKTGMSRIEKAKLNLGSETLFTDETAIMTLENPDNIKVKPQLHDEDKGFFIDSGNSLFEDIPQKKEEDRRKKLNIRKL